MIRARLRAFVPLAVRQGLAAARRALADHHAGFSPTRSRLPDAGDWPSRVTVTQEVRGSDPLALQGKIANLARAAADIDGICLAPGQVWSFWACLGRPSAARGYAAGRNLVDGRVVHEAGGGLCQASGLLYHLALAAGLEVLERHAHSVDLYHESERVTPLGADATVVWGVKDLRVRNPHPFPVALRLRSDEGVVRAEITAPEPLPARTLAFEAHALDDDHVRVRTLRDGTLLTTTTYLRRPGLQANARR